MEYVTRFIVTTPASSGLGRTMLLEPQGRNTHPSAEEAENWVHALFSEHGLSESDIKQLDLKVQPCFCYPGHFFPLGSFPAPLFPLEQFTRKG